MTSAEFAEEMAYYRIDPWGEERADLRAGIIASLVDATIPRKHGRSRSPAQLMPFLHEAKQERSTEELQSQFRMVSRSWNKKGNHGDDQDSGNRGGCQNQ
jgi:hypothetical protein